MRVILCIILCFRAFAFIIELFFLPSYSVYEFDWFSESFINCINHAHAHTLLAYNYLTRIHTHTNSVVNPRVLSHADPVRQKNHRRTLVSSAASAKLNYKHNNNYSNNRSRLLKRFDEGAERW